jgi:hypothetical protein
VLVLKKFSCKNQTTMQPRKLPRKKEQEEVVVESPMMIADSSDDDDTVKFTPDYIGSNRGWTELWTIDCNHWIARMVNRYSSRYRKHNTFMRKMRKQVLEANYERFPWLNTPSYVRFKPGEEVEIADESLSSNSGTIVKSIKS